MTTKEQDLIAAGPVAVLSAIQIDGSSLNLHGLAQACGRAARTATSLDLALAWTDAAIAAYASKAASLSSSVTRNGLEIIAFGLRIAIILRFGVVSERTGQYVSEIERWLFDGVRDLNSPAQLSVTPAPINAEREYVLLAQERFRVAADLWKQGLLHRELDPWFSAVINLPNGTVPRR